MMKSRKYLLARNNPCPPAAIEAEEMMKGREYLLARNNSLSPAVIKADKIMNQLITKTTEHPVVFIIYISTNVIYFLANSSNILTIVVTLSIWLLAFM